MTRTTLRLALLAAGASRAQDTGLEYQDWALRCQALEAGKEAWVSFHTLNGSRVGVPVSLFGMTAGLNALDTVAGREQRSKTK